MFGHAQGERDCSIRPIYKFIGLSSSEEWQEEIRRMLASGLKYELDALANKDFRYLTKTYPRKLKEKDWLD